MTMTSAIQSDRAFVLADDAPYLANLAALWSVDPTLAMRVEAVGDCDCHAVEPSKSGEPTVAVTVDGRKNYLHSRYQPADEADRVVSGFDFTNTFFYYVHGLGLGYHLELIFDRAPVEAIICLFEPDLAMLKTAFFTRDLSRLIQSRRILFFTHADKGEFFTRLTPSIAMLTDGSKTFEHPPSLRLHPEFHQTFKTWSEEFNSYTATNISTLIQNGRRTAENIARNLGWYVATPCISRLHHRHRNKPAIIVSAGPSLRKNKHLLKEAAGRAIIIAVQTTLRPLLDMGIVPDYVTSLDYHDICTRFFENLPPDLTTHLVAEPKASPKIFSLYPGPISILGNDFAERLLREAKPGRTCLTAGATVAHLAFYLAEHLGCDPILFVGQDLGFSDGLCYTPGTSYEQVWEPELSRFCTLESKQWEQIVRDRPILRRIPDYLGRPMYTEQRLFTYLQQFERDFARSDRTILDCTEGGAAKRGARSMPLREALDHYCTESFIGMPSVEFQPQWQRLDELFGCLESRLAESLQIEAISRQTLMLLRQMAHHGDDQNQLNRIIAEIDGLRSRMNQLGNCYDLVAQLTQKTQLQRFKHDRQISSANFSAAEKQRRQIERDIENVAGILDAAIAFSALMADVISQLEDQAAMMQSKEAA